MKASYFACMGYSDRHQLPAIWPAPPAYQEPGASRRTYREGLAECELAENVGFDWISVSEHHYSGSRTTPNPAVMAAAVAERCRRVKIALLGKLLPINNPVRVAEEIGMLDNLTDGRLVVAFMRGTPNEDAVHGVDREEARSRLLEGMDIVLNAISQPEPFSWHGEHYQYDTVAVWPRPVQQPRLPIFVATRSEPTVRYAAANRLGIAVSYDPVDDMQNIIRAYRQSCADAGWQPTPDHIAYRGGICLAETDSAAQDQLARILEAADGKTAPDASSGDRYAGKPAPDAPPDPRLKPANPPRVNANRGIGFMMNFVGGPDTVVKQLREYHDKCGVGVVDLAFQQPGLRHETVMESIALFGREVLPRIRDF